MKVVIFDDLLCQHQRLYRMPGLELSFYDNADQAPEILRREQPDVVLMDYSMEAARSGAEVVAGLRGRGEFAGLRIVGISADRESNERLLQAGTDDAVPKTHVRGYLRRLLDQQTMNHNLR